VPRAITFARLSKLWHGIAGPRPCFQSKSAPIRLPVAAKTCFRRVKATTRAVEAEANENRKVGRRRNRLRL
jgi:hypothetical protein